MKFLVSILLLSTIIGATMAYGIYDIHGTINCPMYSWVDEIIASTPWKCFSGPQQKVVHRVDLGDSFPGEHEVVVVVRHNCQATWKDMRLSYDFPSDSFKKSTINYTLNLLHK